MYVYYLRFFFSSHTSNLFANILQIVLSAVWCRKVRCRQRVVVAVVSLLWTVESKALLARARLESHTPLTHTHRTQDTLTHTRTHAAAAAAAWCRICEFQNWKTEKHVKISNKSNWFEWIETAGYENERQVMRLHDCGHSQRATATTTTTTS